MFNFVLLNLIFFKLKIFNRDFYQIFLIVN